MQSIRALYNDELVEAHREAVAALRELLATEKDPLERRKLANAILRARPAKEEALPPSPAPSGRQCGRERSGRTPEVNQPAQRLHHPQDLRVTDEGALSAAPRRRVPAILSDDHDDDFDDLNDPANREIDDLAHQLQHGPDPLAALGKLQAIMTENIAALTPTTGASESP